MHIHILGICGTFMGGVAVLATQLGYRVTGCDENVYPPMSKQLEGLGIELINGWNADQVKLNPDVFVIGNVITRGNPLMERILNDNLNFLSGPQWLSEYVLKNKWVLGVAGTHGKTTTASMLAWLMEFAELKPGFLIGGLPHNFGVSARITDSPFFVIEADEYDTAYFDKRSKFIHYKSRTTILNNLEFDHADIFPNLLAIETQFHHLIRMLPGNGLIVINQNESAVKRVLERGCWTAVDWFNSESGLSLGEVSSGKFEVLSKGKSVGLVDWSYGGAHYRSNALAALAAARHVGVPIEEGIAALGSFSGVKRRLEKRGVFKGIEIYDDFAHHPTAIKKTLEGLHEDSHSGRLIAVFEPRSNTMKLGIGKENLVDSLKPADKIYCFSPKLNWNMAEIMSKCTPKGQVYSDQAQLISDLSVDSRPGDRIIFMSNGSFGDIIEKFLIVLSNN